MTNFLALLEQSYNKKRIPEKLYKNFHQLYTSYVGSMDTALQSANMQHYDLIFKTFLEKVEEQVKDPHIFQSFHKKITFPFDYHKFGKEFTRPLVDLEKSHIFHLHNVDKMKNQIQANENVVLFANHQTEIDPQLIGIILENTHSNFGSDMIFVAGDRVTTDPLAIPFSMGLNLLCIYSKRHIENPPEKKFEKQQHNQRTMKVMRELFSEGGKCIYVAPSGGRDRMNSNGIVEVAPFDPQSIEMFRLMAKQAHKPTHFYPLALATYEILPPPLSIQHDLGEIRKAKREGVFFSFGDEIDMEHFPGADDADRHARRSLLASHIWNLVNNDYLKLKK